MRFEDALKLMREGEKIRHPHWEPDECLVACYVRINPLLCPDGVETIELVKARGMSICKMKGEYQHPDMRPVHPLKIDGCPKIDLHLQPQISLLLLMSDDWEVVGQQSPAVTPKDNTDIWRG